MNQIISSILIVGGIGLIFGLILAFASFIFKVEEDERIPLVTSELPGANCGACGYAGCSAYATAVVEGTAPLNGCSVGKTAVAEKIAEIMGTKVEAVEETTAVLLCAGTCDTAVDKYEYAGISSCVAANKLSSGQKLCEYGCLGFGDCKKVCDFDAISIENGIANIDSEKCTSCGKCVKACPKAIIKILPKAKKYVVKCSSKASGQITTKSCKVGCIACRICEKNCPVGAIKVNDNCAVIDYSLCTECGICVEKCPKKIIVNK